MTLTPAQLNSIRDRLATMAGVLTHLIRTGPARGVEVTALRQELAEVVRLSDELAALAADGGRK